MVRKGLFRESSIILYSFKDKERGKEDEEDLLGKSEGQVCHLVPSAILQECVYAWHCCTVLATIRFGFNGGWDSNIIGYVGIRGGKKELGSIILQNEGHTM